MNQRTPQKRGKRGPSPWSRMRATHLLTYPECRICERTDDPAVHHLRYRGPRGESEQPGDLVTLCQRHHDDFHRRYGRAGSICGSLIDLTLGYIREQRALALDAIPLP